MADKPFMDGLLKKYPHCQNDAAGEAVGLPKGTMGNSEVGHLHIGAGRIVWQELALINNAIKDGSFFSNKVLLNSMERAKESRLHLIGLCSDKGVHSSLEHLYALLEMAKKQGVHNVYIHFIADGRDAPEKSALHYVKEIEAKCHEIGVGDIASVMGRFYAMDRDHNWNRTKIAYDLIVHGRGKKVVDASSAIKDAYKKHVKTDYYLKPYRTDAFVPIEKEDVVVFFNFRTDRPRQLTKMLIDGKKDVVTMTEYEEDFSCDHAFAEPSVSWNLGNVLAQHKLRQLRVAETEKYAHVTYFFNSQDEEPCKGEERIMLESDKVKSYDLAPDMKAFEITKEVDAALDSGKYDFVLVNYANCDLVGHAGDKESIIRAVEVVDACTEMVVHAGLKNGYTVCITADHGNAEDKLYPNGKVKPAHSLDPVHFILVSDDKKLSQVKLHNGGQSDVAPTILKIMGLKKPDEMTGKSLF
jgi:2,3-bisphosphoglycerate-independent phosphoglycerate mutase